MILSPDLKAILDSAESDAERLVARLLLKVDGDPDAVAFHSVKLRSHRRKQEAEADFVVLWKGVVVVFEVKGGGVRKVDGSGEWAGLPAHRGPRRTRRGVSRGPRRCRAGGATVRAVVDPSGATSPLITGWGRAAADGAASRPETTI